MSNSRKPLPAKKWAEIAALWAIGDVLQKELAEKYGVRPETISRKMKKMGIVYGERAEEQARLVQEEVERTAAGDSKLLAARVNETKEEVYKHSRALSLAAVALIHKANREKIPIATAEGDLKAIERAMKIQGMRLNQSWIVLGQDKGDIDDDDLPELVIREMTKQEIVDTKGNAERMMGVDVSDFDMPGVPLPDIEDLGEDDSDEPQEDEPDVSE